MSDVMPDLDAYREFMEAQAVDRANNHRIENIFVEVLEQGRDYKKCIRRLTEENKLLKRAMRKFYKVGVDERTENGKIRVELKALKKSHNELQRKLEEVEGKYQRLLNKLTAVIREVDVEQNNEDEVIESSQVWEATPKPWMWQIIIWNN